METKQRTDLFNKVADQLRNFTATYSIDMNDKGITVSVDNFQTGTGSLLEFLTENGFILTFEEDKSEKKFYYQLNF